jgi:hypothetical protein
MNSGKQPVRCRSDGILASLRKIVKTAVRCDYRNICRGESSKKQWAPPLFFRFKDLRNPSISANNALVPAADLWKNSKNSEERGGDPPAALRGVH